LHQTQDAKKRALILVEVALLLQHVNRATTLGHWRRAQFRCDWQYWL